MTDREGMEEALRRRERELAEAQRVGQLGSWELDSVANRVSWSDELYRIFGLQPQELEPTFEGFLSHIHPDDRARLLKANHATLRGEADLDLVSRFIRPTGEVGWLHGRGEAVHDETGATLGMRGTALDVTASKLAEAELQDTAARYRLLGAMATAANEAREVEEVLRVAVEEICAYVGWVAGHVYACSGSSVDRLEPLAIWYLADPQGLGGLPATVDSDHSAQAIELAGRVVATGGPAWKVDLGSASATAGGGPALGADLAAVFCFPVLTASRVAYVLEFFSDRLVEPDEVLLETVGQVGTQLARVVERQRANEELAVARDAAMESSRLKSEFLATMSHEIRTPLNGVIGLTGLLLGTGLDDRQREYAEGVHSAGEALMAIINDILDFSKIEAGKLDLELADFDLVQVLEEVTGLVALPAQRKGLELVAYCYPDVPRAVRGDPARVRQVLLNLASNAVKFTERGEVVVRARLARGADPEIAGADRSVVLRFEVVDSGIGVAESDRQRLFEPFSQADASTTRRFGGTGLGLAISHRLVTAMGGEIGFDSEAGRGSTFWFTLPLRPPAGSAAAPASSVHHLLDGLRVLVVDDNDTNRTILRRQLEAWEMLPEAASNGPSALQQLRDGVERGQPYTLGLLDMHMPGMDGLELAQRISTDPALDAIHLVLLTSGADVGADEARQAGIAARLSKPVRLSQLYDTLMRLTAPVPATGPPISGSAVGARGRVLVVEDNATNQMVAVGILSQLGYRSDVAANGIEALAALERTGYAAVLMDCQMPEMDGYEATGEIRRRESESRHTPIIAMTAGAVEGDRERCLAAGMDDYISKPFKPENLAATLQRWVDEALDEAASVSGAEPDAGDDSMPRAAIDTRRLDVLRGIGPGDGSLLGDIAEAFLTGAQTDLAALRQAVNDGDDLSVAASAHRLRGAAANLGAVGVATLCSQLEQLGIRRSLTTAPALVARLAAEVDRASVALRRATTSSSP